MTLPGTAPISELVLSQRIHNCLSNADITQVADLASMTDSDLLMLKNFGRHSLAEVRRVVSAISNIADYDAIPRCPHCRKIIGELK